MMKNLIFALLLLLFSCGSGVDVPKSHTLDNFTFDVFESKINTLAAEEFIQLEKVSSTSNAFGRVDTYLPKFESGITDFELRAEGNDSITVDAVLFIWKNAHRVNHENFYLAIPYTIYGEVFDLYEHTTPELSGLYNTERLRVAEKLRSYTSYQYHKLDVPIGFLIPQESEFYEGLAFAITEVGEISTISSDRIDVYAYHILFGSVNKKVQPNIVPTL